MKAYLQQESTKMQQRHNDEERMLRRNYSDDVTSISRQLIIDGSSDQLFYHIKALRIGACVLAVALAYLLTHRTSFWVFLLCAGTLAGLALLGLEWAREEKCSDARRIVNAQTCQREDRLRSDLSAMQQRHRREKKRLERNVQDKMNSLIRTYNSSSYMKLLVSWLLSELEREIIKADRAPYYPNVKAGFSFEVSRSSIRVPGRPGYSLSGQGFTLPDGPLAASALARALADSVQEKGRQRFRTDPAGGHGTVECIWNENTGVQVKYSAANGNVRL